MGVTDRVRFQQFRNMYCRPISPELIAILAVAAALAGLILRQSQQLGQRVDRLDQRLTEEIQQLTADVKQLDQRLTGEIASLRDGQVQLGERMARLERMIETAFRLTPTEAA